MQASLESLREQFKPHEIAVLLVGESPPASGAFFYRCNSNLFRFTKEAFEKAFNTEFQSDTDFLVMFQNKGYYLDDLSHRPLNGLDDTTRKRVRAEATGELADRIRGYAPDYVIGVMKGVKREVEEAASRASIPTGRIFSLPFPSTGNQRRYVKGLVEVLRKIKPLKNNLGSPSD